MCETGTARTDFIEESGVMKVVFYKDKFTEEFLQKMGLNERQIEAVMYVKKKGSINLSAFRNLVPEISEKTLYRDLRGLVDRGILKESGKKKGRRYELE